MWSDGGENLSLIERPRWLADVAADLRVKRARYSAVQTPLVMGVSGARVEPLADITSRRWSLEEDAETCATAAAAAGYEAAVGSPSVTSSGRRDSIDEDDDDEGTLTLTHSEMWLRNCAFPPSVDELRQRRRSSVESLDKKQTGTNYSVYLYFVIRL